MSWWDDVTGAIGGVVDWFGEHKTASSLLSTVVTGFALNKVQESIASESQSSGTAQRAKMDYGSQVIILPAQDNKIPVLYGKATVSGIVTDAVMSNNRTTMTYVVTICEKTGTLGPSGADSVIKFNEIYWNRGLVKFKADGITAESLTDPDGNVDTNIDGLVKIWCYNNGSSVSTSPVGYSSGTHWAYQNVPNWDSSYTMDSLVFCVIQVTYNKEKGMNGLPTMTFTMQNSLTEPGDVIYDYMTNTRYGCGIAPADINY